MIIGKETNTVYLSKLLKTDRFSGACIRLLRLMDNHEIQYKFLEGTRDIWCRDYMPIQVEKDKYVKFGYKPSYLTSNRELQSDFETVYQESNLNFRYNTSKINLDGGNVVNWSDKVIITDRIFDENPRYSRKNRLIESLEKNLESEVIIIPQIKSDLTGHADGHVRFVNNSTIIGNDRKREYKYWKIGIDKVLKAFKLDYIDIPFFDPKDNKNPDSAVGYYINYLEIGHLIILPIFEIKGNKDYEAFEVIKKVFTDRIVETINVNEIGIGGGLLNCISWTVKETTT
jgi:agmatine deiminase